MCDITEFAKTSHTLSSNFFLINFANMVNAMRRLLLVKVFGKWSTFYFSKTPPQSVSHILMRLPNDFTEAMRLSSDIWAHSSLTVASRGGGTQGWETMSTCLSLNLRRHMATPSSTRIPLTPVGSPGTSAWPCMRGRVPHPAWACSSQPCSPCQGLGRWSCRATWCSTRCSGRHQSRLVPWYIRQFQPSQSMFQFFPPVKPIIRPWSDFTQLRIIWQQAILSYLQMAVSGWHVSLALDFKFKSSFVSCCIDVSEIISLASCRSDWTGLALSLFRIFAITTEVRAEQGWPPRAHLKKPPVLY